MSFLNKLGIGAGGHGPRESARPLAHGRSGSHGHVGTIAVGPHREPELQELTPYWQSRRLQTDLLQPAGLARYGYDDILR